MLSFEVRRRERSKAVLEAYEVVFSPLRIPSSQELHTAQARLHRVSSDSFDWSIDNKVFVITSVLSLWKLWCAHVGTDLDESCHGT